MRRHRSVLSAQIIVRPLAASSCLCMAPARGRGVVRQVGCPDHGAKEKVLIDLGCAPHNAMWERNHLLLFKASLEWLKDGQVNGMSEGELKLGY